MTVSIIGYAIIAVGLLLLAVVIVFIPQAIRLHHKIEQILKGIEEMTKVEINRK